MFKRLSGIELIKKKLFSNSIRKKNFHKNLPATFLEKHLPFCVVDFRNIIKINVINSTKDDLVLNLTGLDLSFANGIRRILISEITIICIDKIFFYYNSSILNDEMLSHRLGLIPVFVAFDILEYFYNSTNNLTKKIIFEIDTKHHEIRTKKFSIYSKALEFMSYGVHFSWLKNLQVKPAFRDIIVAKLNPGHKIKCECHCDLGNGEIHAKFSAVGAAFYRIFPQVKILNEILNLSAIEILKKCPVSVFRIRHIYNQLCRVLFVFKPERCTLCRDCIKVITKEKIRIGRIREKITFIIESTGVSTPEGLFHRAICLLAGKCNQSISVLFKNFNKC